MIIVHRSPARRHIRGREHHGWSTFGGSRHGRVVSAGFGALAILDEHRVAPSASVPPIVDSECEVVTYVREGALSFDNPSGESGVIVAGEFQCVAPGRATRYRATNSTRTGPSHVFQIGFRCEADDDGPGGGRARFGVTERRDALRLVASRNGDLGSLCMRQDVRVYSAIIAAGRHVVHETASGRSAWLHVVIGNASFADVVLAAGDHVGFVQQRVVRLTAREPTEILLVDLPE